MYCSWLDFVFVQSLNFHTDAQRLVFPWQGHGAAMSLRGNVIGLHAMPVLCHRYGTVACHGGAMVMP